MFCQPLPIIFLLVSMGVCAPERVDIDHDSHGALLQDAHPQDLQDQVAPMEKRSPHYNFGLGKRAYSYVSEYKRLPVYNFGLGKRYSFGLGQRSVEEDQTDEDFSNEIEQAPPSEVFEQYDDTPAYEVKRARPYSFGLGKRSAEDDDTKEKRARHDSGLGKRPQLYSFGLGKRSAEDETEEKRARYDFGLGKRPQLYSFGLGKRARGYNFGLGKRLSSKFNFGLGKRERDLHRFSFGLGKRSDTIDDTDGYYEV